MTVDTLDVLSQLDAGQRRVRVRSEVLNLALAGDFTPSTVIRDVADAGGRSTALISRATTTPLPLTTAASASSRLPDYQVALNLYLKQPNPLLHLFVPQITHF